MNIFAISSFAIIEETASVMLRRRHLLHFLISDQDDQLVAFNRWRGEKTSKGKGTWGMRHFNICHLL